MARKRKSKPTGKRRAEIQKVKDRLAHAQDDAQRLGIIPTVPEEALRTARVDPASQGEQQLPKLVAEAARSGWATPDDKKPIIVAKLIEPFLKQDEVVLDREGNPVVVPPDRYLLKENAKVLAQLDKHQWERDNPELAGKAKGGVKVEVEKACSTEELAELLRRAEQQRAITVEVEVKENKSDQGAECDEAIGEPGQVATTPPPPPSNGQAHDQ